MNNQPNTTPLRDDLHESRYSRLQVQLDLAQRIIKNQAEALQATDAEMQRALEAERTLTAKITVLRDAHMALHIELTDARDACKRVGKEISVYQQALTESERARDAQAQRLKAADYVHDDDKRAWRGLEAFWLSVLVACIVVLIKSCGGVA
jgi:chromosome segregation ATPase